MAMIRVLVSACLLGDQVRYNGAAARSSSAILAAWLAEGRVVRFCPEVAGGLGVPRPPAEIVGGGGDAVLAGTARLVTRSGADVTDAFAAGARLALEAARTGRAGLAILKEGSPSCGSHRINDGSFSGTKIPGRGVTAALLERHGIRVFSEDEIEAASEYLRQLEIDDSRSGGATL
jgi:uncharacterized protein YbbK (DUF523 family)